jgi:hypothetical protein
MPKIRDVSLCYNININSKIGKEMPRKPRLDMAGFPHIVNRGIERSNEDKEKFLHIVYKVNLHD